LSIDNDTFTCDNSGENTVILTVTDAAGNTSTCEAIVTVAECAMPCCGTNDELSIAVSSGF